MGEIAAELAAAGSKVLPGPSLAPWAEKHSGQPVRRCYQCRKCSGGCPVSENMDLLPHQVVRYVQLGLEEQLLKSRSIWVCASCRTCKSRCPNGIDIAAIGDALKTKALEQGIRPSLPEIASFHRAFLKSVEGNGRVHELGMMLAYKLKTKTYFQDVPLGWAMFQRGKLKLLPERIRQRREVRELFRRSKEWRP